MSGVAVREYASAEEMLAAYRARARPPAPVVRMPEPVISTGDPSNAGRLWRITIKNGMRYGRWTETEIKRLADLAAQGFTRKQIAQKLNRSYHSVDHRATTCGIRISGVPKTANARDVLLLSDSTRPAGDAPKMVEITAAIARAFDVTLNDIRSQTRNSIICAARHQAMWLCARDTTQSYCQIGRFFERDHTTVLHAIRRENERRGADVRKAGLPR